MYPDKNMSIGIRPVDKPPLVHIMPQGINFTVPAAVDFYILDKNDSPLAFSLGIVSPVSDKKLWNFNSWFFMSDGIGGR